MERLTLTAMDIEWAEFVAGRKLESTEVEQLKADFEAWLDEMERMDEDRDVNRWE